jgi:hypothetical protein
MVKSGTVVCYNSAWKHKLTMMYAMTWSNAMTPPATLEERVAALEETVALLLSQTDSVVAKKDWRSTLGMFADDPILKEIDEEGRRIREADRQQAQP